MKTTTEMQLVPITKLVPYVNNARTHSPEQINKLRSSLREFGFINPVIIDRDYEEDCLQYCKNRGYDWSGLYDYFNRVSCWCCPLQSLSELRELYRHFPALWEQLKKWDSMTWRKFRADYSVLELERRFDFEEEWLQDGNTSLRIRAFFNALKERLSQLE